MRKLVTSIAVTVGSVLATAVPAFAQTGGYNPPPTVQPTVVVPPAAGPAAAPAAAPLAFTGVEIGLLVLAAGLLATLGAMLLIAARRRSAAAA